MNRDFKGIWIPKEIWLQKGLSAQEKCLWAEIHSLYSADVGGCYASNEYLMDFLNVKERRLQEMLSNLKKKKFIIQVGFDGRTRILKAVMPPESDEINDDQNGGGKVPGRGAEKCTPGRKVHPRGAEKCTPSVHETAPLPTPCPYNIENKEENKEEEDIAQTAARPRKKAPEISFSFDKQEFENITEQDMKNWKELYPEVDISRELKEMIQWNLSNPTKAKSKKLWRKFILGWLQRSNEKLVNQAAYKQVRQNPVLSSKHTGFAAPKPPNWKHPREIDLSQEVPQNLQGLRHRA